MEYNCAMSDVIYDEIVDDEIKIDDISFSGESTAKTYLVFKSACENSSHYAYYAVESSRVKEVVRNGEIYKLPFVPQYIRGVLNFYGKPYAVVDFAKIRDLDFTQENLFLVLNDKGEVAIQVSEIYEFFSDADVIIQEISSKNDGSFFSHSIFIDQFITPVLDVDAILSKVRKDVEQV